MIDLRAARADPDAYRAALARKGAEGVFDELLAADRDVRAIQPEVERLRARRKLKGKPAQEQREELESVKRELDRLDGELATLEARRDELLVRVPNPPDPSAPDGFTEDDALVVREV